MGCIFTIYVDRIKNIYSINRKIPYLFARPIRDGLLEPLTETETLTEREISFSRDCMIMTLSAPELYLLHMHGHNLEMINVHTYIISIFYHFA